MDGIWQYLVEIHTAGQWETLVQFYGLALAVLILVIILLLHSRSRGIALKAARLAHNLEQELRKLPGALERIESDLESRLATKTNQKIDAVEAHVQELHGKQGDLLEERCSELAADIGKTDVQVQRTNAQIEGLKNDLEQVEARIPSLLDRLDDFREAVAKRCQGELASVLGSFDKTVRAVLTQMKGELQVGVSRIEGIESMIRNRKQAEMTLLGTGVDDELPPGAESEAGMSAVQQAAPAPGATAQQGEERLELDAIPEEEEAIPDRWFEDDEAEGETEAAPPQQQPGQEDQQ